MARSIGCRTKLKHGGGSCLDEGSASQTPQLKWPAVAASAGGAPPDAARAHLTGYGKPVADVVDQVPVAMPRCSEHFPDSPFV